MIITLISGGNHPKTFLNISLSLNAAFQSWIKTFDYLPVGKNRNAF